GGGRATGVHKQHTPRLMDIRHVAQHADERRDPHACRYKYQILFVAMKGVREATERPVHRRVVARLQEPDVFGKVAALLNRQADSRLTGRTRCNRKWMLRTANHPTANSDELELPRCVSKPFPHR